MSRAQSARRFSLVGLMRKLLTGGRKKPFRHPAGKRPLYLEPLEDRTVPTVIIDFDAPNRVLFQSLLPTDTDTLHLRVTNNVLEYSLDGTGYSRDLDPAPGVQALIVNQATEIRADVGGTVFLDRMNRVGGKIISLGELVVKDGVTLSTRTIAGNANPNVAASTSDSLNLTIQAPDLRVGNGVRILAHADNGFQGGDIQLIADAGFDLTWQSVTPLFNVQNADATIDVGAATIKGRNITITSAATTKKYADFDINAEALNDVIDRAFAKISQPEITELAFAPIDSGDTITRSTGSWLQDGFQAGQLISVQGSLHNDGLYRIASLTANTITLTQRNVLDAETRSNVIVAQTLAVLNGTPGLTFERNILGRDRIIRDSGSWLDDGFAVGQTILVEFANDSDGQYQIADLTATEMTLVEGGSLDGSTFGPPTVMAGNPDLTFRDLTNAPRAFLSNPETVELTFSASDTIVRTAGSWLTDGFRAGQLITVQGTQNNDGLYRVVGATDFTLTLAPDSGLTDENQTGVFVAQAVVRDEIRRATGSWLADGFRAGMTIRVEGSGSNDGDYVIDYVQDNILILNDDAELTNETRSGVTVRSLHPRVAQVYDALPQPNIPVTIRDRLNNLIPDVRLEVNDVINNLKLDAVQLQQLEDYVGAVQAIIAQANSHVSIRSGAEIDATGNVVISSDAESEATLKSPGFAIPTGGIGLPVAVGFGSSEAEARAIVENGVTIHAGNLFNLRADVQNTLDVELFSYSGLILGGNLIKKGLAGGPSNPLTAKLKHPVAIPTPSLTTAYGRARSDSEATLDSGATVTAGTAFVTAANTNNFNVDSLAKTLFPRKNTGSGMGIAVSDVGSEAHAQVDGSLTTTGDATVSAQSVNEKNRTRAEAAIKNEIPATGLFAKASKKAEGARGIDKLNASLGKTTNDVGIAAGFAVAVSSNKAEARIGSDDPNVGTAPVVAVGGNLTVMANAADNFTAFAKGGMESKSRIALGGALNLDLYSNEARAFIGHHAVVDVGQALTVASNVEIPNQITVDDTFPNVIRYFDELQLSPPNEHLAPDSPQELVQGVLELFDYGRQQGIDAASTFVPLIGYGLGLFFRVEGVATTYTNASAEGDTPDHNGVFAFAGTVDILQVSNHSEAFIAEAARVNQTPTFVANTNQSVTVEATTSIETVNIAGLATFISLFTSKGGGGAKSDGSVVGANTAAAIYDNTAKAYIDDGAQVAAARDVTVHAETNVFSLGLAQAGGDAQKFGFAETTTVHHFTTEAIACIEETARVEARQGNVVVEADTDLKSIELALGLQQGGQRAVGATASVNVFDTTTYAVIGNVEDSTVTSPGLVKAGGDVRVDADASELSLGLSLAGAIAKNPPAPPGGGSTYPAAQPSPGILASVKSAPSDALNFIRGARNSWTPATSHSSAIVIGSHRSDNPPRSGPARLFIGDHRAGGGKSVSGLASAASVAAASSAGQSVFGLGLSGDLVLNLIDNDTLALIADTTVYAGGNVAVVADSHNITGAATTALTVNAAGGTVNLKGASLAGSLTFDVITRTTRALTENAAITTGSVTVEADSTDQQVAAAAGGAGSSHGNLNVAGSLNVHALDSETAAALGNNTTVNATGNVTVDADSKVQIISVAGALTAGSGSGGGTQISFGAGLDGGAIINLTEAYIGTGAVVQAGGNVHVLASNQEDVLSVAGALAISPRQVGVAGSGTVQVIVTEAMAYIEDGAIVTAGGSVVIDSDDETRVAILAGTGAGGKTAGVGEALSTLGIYRTVFSFVGEGATVTARGLTPASPNASDRGLVIDATALDLLAVFAGSGSGAQSVSVAASQVPVMLASQTEAFIAKNARINPDNTGAHNDQSVLLHADHDTFLATGAGGLSITVGQSGVGVGAAANLVGMGKDVRAYIDERAQVKVKGDVVVEAEAQDRLLALTGSVGFGGNVDIAGSLGAFALISNTAAFLGDNTTVTADGNVIVAALSELQFLPFAGQGSFGGQSAGVGVSNIALIHVDFTEAYIGSDAQVTALGNRAAREVYTGERELPFSDKETEPLRGLSVTATSYEDLLPIAVGAAGAGRVALAGSGVETILIENTRASIGERCQINVDNTGAGLDQSVNVLASDQTNIVSLAGAAAVAVNGVGIGFGADVGVLVKTTQAYLDEATTVNAARDVKVQALAAENLVSFTINAGGASHGSGAGAFNVWSLTTATRAYIDDNARVKADGNVLVSADSDARMALLAGGIGIAQYAGIGLSNTTLVKIDTTEAWIGSNANVTALGVSQNASSIDAPTGDQDFLGSNSTQPFRGVAVTATSFEELSGAAVAAGGAQNAAIAASGVVTTLVETTRATIEDHAQINADNSGAGTDQGVYVLAADDTRLRGAGGAGGVSIQPDPFNFGVGVGAGADVGVLVKTTEATIGDDALADAAGNVQVRALSDEFIVSAAASAGIGGGVAVGIAGAAGIHAAIVTTRATLGKRSHVSAEGSVVVEADDDADIITAGGNISGGLGGLGATIAASALVQTTESLIDEDATVIALGNRPGVVVHDGLFQVTFEPYPTFNPSASGLITQTLNLGYNHGFRTGQALIYDNGGGNNIGGLESGHTYFAIVDPDSPTTIRLARTRADAENGRAITLLPTFATGTRHSLRDALEVRAPEVSNLDLTDQALTRKRVATAETKTIRGLAVTATTSDQVYTVGLSGSVGAVAGSFAGAAHVSKVDTHATIADGVKVNAGVTPNPEQSVLVAAGVDHFTFNLVGTAAGAAANSYGPALDAAVVLLDTRASVGRAIDDTTTAAGVEINVGQDLQVSARAQEDVLVLTAGFAGSFGGTALSGALGFYFLDSTTHAYLGNNVTASAGNNVLVSARDDTDTDLVSGALSFAVGSGLSNTAAGGSIGTTVLLKDTQAYLGRNAVVDARANGNTSMGVYTGTIAGDDFLTEQVRGLAVQAASHEDILAVSASGAVALGGSVDARALAGAISLQVVDSDTRAFIGDSGHVNQNSGAGSEQTVNVSAVNETDILAIQGSAAGTTLGALAGGLDVGVIRNDTTAYLGNGACVSARSDVDVNALSRKEVESIAVSAAGAIVGLGGSASVYVLGAPFSTEATASITAHDGSGNRVDSFADGESRITDVLGLLSNYSETDQNGDDPTPDNNQEMGKAVRQVRTTINDRLPRGEVARAITSTVVPDGTSAFIGVGATIEAGRNVQVVAEESLDLHQVAGGVALGVGLGVGGSASVAVIGSQTRAYVGDGTTISAAREDAIGDVTIRADLAEELDSIGIAGGIGGLVGLGAQATVLIDSSTQDAHVGNGVQITSADTVSVIAEADRDLDALSVGASTGAITAGVSVAQAQAGGSTRAYLGDGVKVGQESGRFVRNLVVTADSDTRAEARSEGMSVGIVALTGSAAQALIHADGNAVQAAIGQGAQVIVIRDVTVTATEKADATARAGGVNAGGINVGVSLAEATIRPTVTATLRSGSNVLSYEGTVAVNSYFNSNPIQLDRGASAEAEGISGNLLGGVGASAKATVAPVVETSLGGPNTTIAAANSVHTSAQSHRQAEADAFGWAVGLGGSVGVSIANAIVGGRTTDRIEDGTNIDAGFRITAVVLTSGDADAQTTAASGGLLLATQVNKATAAVGQPGDSQASVGDNARLQAGEDVLVRVFSNADARANAVGVAIGALAIGANVAEATITPDIDATIGDNAVVLAGGRITVDALHNTDISFERPFTDRAVATAGASGKGDENALANVSAGLIAATGARARARVAPQVDSRVAPGARLEAGSEVILRARSFSNADAASTGVTVGLVSAGAILADAETGGHTRADLSAGLVKSSSLSVTARGQGLAEADATAAGGGVFSGSGADADATVNSTVAAVLSERALADIRGNVAITAESLTDADADAQGITVGVFQVGVSLADANVTAKVDAGLNPFAILNADGNVTITAAHNFDLASDTGRSDRSATATADASGGGLIAGNGARATANSNADVNSFIGGVSTVDADGDLTIKARSRNDAQAFGSGLTVGLLVGVGGVEADADASGNTHASIGRFTAVRAGDTLTVDAVGQDTARAKTNAADGGLLSGFGSDAAVDVVSTVRASIGDNAFIEANTVTLRADGSTGMLAQAEGSSVGGIDVGLSHASVSGTATVETYILDNAKVTATADLNLLSNYHPASVSQAESNGSLGSLIVGVVGADADGRSTTTTRAFLARGSQVTAGGNITIKANGQDRVDAEASNRHGSAIAEGKSEATTDLTGVTEATVGDSVRVSAGGNFTLSAVGDFFSDAFGDGSGGGVIDISQSDAHAQIKPTTTARVGTNSQIQAGGDVIVESLTQADVTAVALVDASGLGTGADTDVTAEIYKGGGVNYDLLVGNPRYTDDSVFVVYAAPTLTEVANGARVQGRNVTLKAWAPLLQAFAKAETDTTAAGTDTDANAKATIVSSADVVVKDSARVLGEDVHLLSQTGLPNITNVRTTAITDSDPDAGAGVVASNATNVQFLRTRVQGNSAAEVEATDLIVEAIGPQTMFFTQALHYEDTPAFDEDISEDRRGKAETRIDWNAHTTILAPDEALTRFLIIDGDGTVRSGAVDPNNPTGFPQPYTFPITRTSDSLVVHDITDITSGGVGMVTFNVKLPTLLTDDEDDREDYNDRLSASNGLFGNGSFDFRVSPGDISIINNSELHLVLEGVNPNTSIVQPEIQYLGALAESITLPGLPPFIPSVTFFPYRHHSFTTQVDPTPGPMDITISSFGLTSDIILSGHINNPLGFTSITSNWGDIVATNINAVVSSRFVRLDTFLGDVGATGARVPVQLVQTTTDVIPSISGRTGGEMHLNIRGVTPVARPVTINLNRLDAGGVLDVQVFTGLVQSPTAGVSMTPTTVLVDHLASSGSDVRLGAASLADIVLTGEIAEFPTVQARGTALIACDGSIRDDRSRPITNSGAQKAAYIDADTVLLQAWTTIGTAENSLNIRASHLEAATQTDGIWIDNTGNLTVGSSNAEPFFAGIRAGGPVSLITSGVLTLAENITAPQRVLLIAFAISQSSASAQVVTRDLQVAASAGDIGSSTQPFTFNADTLFLSTPPSVPGNNQYLREINTVTVYPILDNVSGTTWLTGGTFLVNGLLQASAVKLSGGTLGGTGALGSIEASSPLEVLGGTVNPGASTGTLHARDVTFRAGSAFHVDLLSTSQFDQLQASGRVDLGGATLTGSVGADVQDGDSFTILTASGGITGRFAQGSYAYLDGKFFLITYNPMSVVLTRSDAPVVSVSGPYSIREGESLTLDASATFDPNGDSLTYAWDVNGDGIFGDATGVKPTLTWAQLQALGINDGPGSFSVRVQVQDNGHSVTSSAASLSVANVAPTITVTGPTSGVRGQTIRLTLRANDLSSADQAANFTYTIKWGDGTPVQTVLASSETQLDHIYTRTGSYTVQMTAADKDGAVSGVATHPVTIQVVQLQGTVLAVGGTEGADKIEFKADVRNGVKVKVNGVAYGDFTGVSKLAAFGQSGNDEIEVSNKIDIPTLLDGGDGNDELKGGNGNDTILGGSGNDKIEAGKGDDTIDGGAGNDEIDAGDGNDVVLGGSGNDKIEAGKGDDYVDGGADNDEIDGEDGNDILLGGAGADKLYGGNDRDLLIGGLGGDALHGGSGDDILIGGTTDHDTNRAALEAVMAEWSRCDANYTLRVNHLRGTLGGRNGSTFLTPATVHDDAERDELEGDSGLDWFFALLGGAKPDKLDDNKAEEFITAL